MLSQSIGLKSPWVAALLNVAPVPMGFGYIYLGLAKRCEGAVYMSISSGILGLILFGFTYSLSIFVDSDTSKQAWSVPVAVLIGAIPVLLFSTLSARDAWNIAKAQNDQKTTPKSE